MRCKPDDLCVIVKTQPAGEFLLGMPVQVLRAAPAPGWWIVKLPHTVCNPITFACGDEGEAPDECLLPIRPDGISDEEVSSLYQSNPTKQGEHA